MRMFLAVVAYGAALLLAPRLDSLGLPALATAAIAVSVGVALASLASGRLHAVAVGAGALAALTHQLVVDASPVLACAALVALTHAPRAIRARTARWRAAHAIGSLVAGAVAGVIVTSYGAGPLELMAAAALAAALVACAPLFVPVDDLDAFTLSSIADELPEAARETLRRAVNARRRAAATLDDLPRRARRKLERAFAVLVRAARARARARGETAVLLDKRLAAHVSSLEKAYAAATAAESLAGELDGTALAEAKQEGDAMEARAAAIAELLDDDVVPPAEPEPGTT